MQLENRRELELKAEREVDHEVEEDGLRGKEEDTFKLEAGGEDHTDEDGEDEETWADEQITEEIYADEDKMEKMVRHLAETNLELHRLTESVLKMEAKMGLVENGEDEKEAKVEEEEGGCNCKREQVESGTRVEEGKDTAETENGGKHEGEKEDEGNVSPGRVRQREDLCSGQNYPGIQQRGTVQPGVWCGPVRLQGEIHWAGSLY